MLDVSGVTLHFGERLLLDSASFHLEDCERAALVGPNGAGKSTLLKIVAGLQTCEAGAVVAPRNSEFGYLPQHLELRSERTLLDECRQVFADVMAHEAEMRELEHMMADARDCASPEFQRIAERYEFLLHELDRHDFHAMDSEIGRVLAGLGFSTRDHQRPCREFSGGWQMRIALARLLLQNPDILLLDEPTNHLDIETIEWLAGWIEQHQGSALMVSHERAFMDRLCTKTIALEGHGRVTVYRGNYTQSLSARAERREQMRRAWENQQREIAQIQRFIDRFRYQASKASLVQSRVKTLERMERVEPPPPDDLQTIHIAFPQPDRTAKEVLRATGIWKSYGENTVLRNVDFALYRGEKVALVGVNGAGKTTLMRLLAGRDLPSEGEILRGGGVVMEYFAQYDNEGLSPDRTVLEEFLSVAPLGISSEGRSILGAFLFQGDDVEKPVRVLSGGERTRLRLAKMLCSRANLLLLDEPTNHLDIASRLTLERALKAFEGTVVFVSHDRYFLDSVPTRIVEIAEGRARSFPGNYSDYLSMSRWARPDAAGAPDAPPEASPAPPPPGAGAAMPDAGEPGVLPGEAGEELQESLVTTEDFGDAEEQAQEAPARRPPASERAAYALAAEIAAMPRKLNKDQRRRLHRDRLEWQRRLEKAKRRVGAAEKEIAALEKRQGEIEREMNRPETVCDAGRLMELTQELEKNRGELQTFMEEWEKAQEWLEKTRAEEPEA